MIIAEGRLSLGWHKPAHLEQLHDLHRCCFPKENWTVDDFSKFASPRSGRTNVLKTLVDDRDTVYGSLLYTLDGQSCRVRRLAVWPDFRRQGMAAFMMNSLCGPLSPIRRKLFMARVRENNLVAQMFFKNGMGFQFDPLRERERDEEQKVDFYEFTYVKTRVPVVTVSDG